MPIALGENEKKTVVSTKASKAMGSVLSHPYFCASKDIGNGAGSQGEVEHQSCMVLGTGNTCLKGKICPHTKDPLKDVSSFKQMRLKLFQDIIRVEERKGTELH